MKYNPQFGEGKVYKLPKESKTIDLFGDNHKNGVYKHYERDTSKRYLIILFSLIWIDLKYIQLKTSSFVRIFNKNIQ